MVFCFNHAWEKHGTQPSTPASHPDLAFLPPPHSTPTPATAPFLSMSFKKFLKDFIYLFLEGGREEKRERSINVWLPLECPLLGTWPTTQACALTRNPTCDPLVCSLSLSPLSHTRQGYLSMSFHVLLWPQWCGFEEFCQIFSSPLSWGEVA